MSAALRQFCHHCGCENTLDEAACRSCGLPLRPLKDGHTIVPVPRIGVPASLGSGRYAVHQLIGEGTRKRVYLAHDAKLDRDAALGILIGNAGEAMGMSRLQREAEVTARLADHPNIVAVYDVGVDGDFVYTASEYMAGGTLSARLETAEGRGFRCTEIIEIGSHVASALEYAHGLGIIHRDVKPANIWFAKDGTAKLGDFGLAVGPQNRDVGKLGPIVGTPAYMPPEQALGQAPDARSDLYALGAVLYEMATGRPPFVGNDPAAVLAQHIHTRPVSPRLTNPELPAALDALILNLLAKDLSERPQTAAAVRTRLAAISSEQQPAPSLDLPLNRVFVGRSNELERLKRGIVATLAKHGQLFLLCGEAGIGKTRMSEEAAEYACANGAEVLLGRCYEGEGAPAYWPWVQVIRAYVHLHDPDTIARMVGAAASVIAQIVPEVRGASPEPNAAALPSGEARFRLFDGIAMFLKRASEERPLVVVLDDLHWADKPSLLLLDFLTQELRNAAVCLIGTYRDVEVGADHPLAEVLPRLRRSEAYERIALSGLNEPDVALLLNRVTGHDVPSGFVETMYAETEGNPFFIIELLRHLTEEGLLVRDRERWTSRLDASRTGIPEGVREVIGRRLVRLSAPCRRMLLAAAVLGRDFSVEKLAAVLADAPDDIDDAIAEAVGAKIVEGLPPITGRYRFTHALIRETLYNDADRRERAVMHRRVAEVLDQLYELNREPHLAELAHHFAEATAAGGDIVKAIAFAVQAAERAYAQLAYEDAALHYRRALHSLGRMKGGEDVDTARILFALGLAEMRAGEVESSRASLVHAAAIARAGGAPELAAQAAVAIGEMSFVKLWVTAVLDDELVGLLEEALGRLSPGDSALRALVFGHLAMALYFTTDHERRSGLSLQAVEMARRLRDPRTLAQTLQTRHWALWGPGNVEERLTVAGEILDIANRLGDRELSLRAHQFQIISLLEQGKLAELDAKLANYSALAEAARQPLYLWYRKRFQAMRALLAGRLDEAEALAAAAVDIGQVIDSVNAMQSYGVLIATLRRERGRLGEMEAGFRSFADRFPGIPAWRCALASVYVEQDRATDVRSIVDPLAASRFHAIPKDAFWVPAICSIVDACVYLEDATAANDVYDLLQPFADHYAVVGNATVSYGSVHRYLGALAATKRCWADAERHFLAAIETHERTGSLTWLGHSLFGLARMLIDRGNDNDIERAASLTDRALGIAGECGLTKLIEKLLVLKLRMQGSRVMSVRSSIDVIVSEVERERPDLRQHAAPEGTVTLLFCDLEGSTVLTERLGDRAALELMRKHNALVRQHVSHCGGFEVELRGDGFLLVFSSAYQALRCAVGIQCSFRDYCAAHPTEPMRVRIGIHTGEAIKDAAAGYYFGRAVIFAARIANEAKGGEIFVSSLTRQLTEGTREFCFGPPRLKELKGFAGLQQVIPVDY